jgi:membrane protein YdbS with pleckstrin-like domain
MIPMTITPNHRLRAKFRVLVWIAFLFVALIFVPIGMAIGADAQGWRGAGIGALVALVVSLIWVPLALWAVDRYYESLAYEVREDEIIVNVGIWTRTVKHVPFRTITNIAIKRDPLDRLVFNLGTLEVQTAGANATQGGAEEALLGLIDYEGVYETVAEALRRYRTLPMAPDQASADALPLANGAVNELLEEVRAIRGLLSKGE